MEESSGDESTSSNKNHITIDIIQKLIDFVKDCTVDDFSKKLRDSGENELSHVSNILSSYFDSQNSSIFYAAIESGNIKLADYLISTYPYLIQNLPFEHQIDISTKIFEAEAINLLHDLLAFYDFPYPKEFKIGSVQDERIQQICTERLLFHEAITKENKKTINEFIDKNRNIKYVFDLNNKPALSYAREIKKFKILYYLRSNGFQAIDDPFDFSDLSEKELRKAKEAASIQTNINIESSCSNDENPILFLTSRSLIYHIRDSRNNQKEYRKLIQRWYEEINKVKFGKELLAAASQCDSLKIVFDFQSESVEQVDMRNFSNCAGVTYPIRKLIIIGSKISKENTEQHIKGVLAHELCHYALKLVYENNENPNYKNDSKTARNLKSIINETKLLVFDPVQKVYIDDECNGIISSVYRSYKSKEHPQELIVRPIHIFAVYDNDKEKSKELEKKYGLLLKFFEDNVLKEFKNFDLKHRLNVRDINSKSGILSTIQTQQYEFTKSIKNLMNFDGGNVFKISTNFPQLLMADIYKYFETDNLVDVSNIFINSQLLRDSQIYDTLKELKGNSLIRVFINSSEPDFDYDRKKELKKNKSLKIIIICSDVNFDIEYKFCDLKNQSKLQLLKSKIQFQNISVELIDLLSPSIDTTKKDKDLVIPTEIESIIDDELFKNLIDGLKINVNNQHFDSIESSILPRNFVSHSQNQSNKKSTQNELIESNEKVVQIIGKPKAGKSWTLKSFERIFLSKYPKMWICYFDLELIHNLLNITQVGIHNFLLETVYHLKKPFLKKIFENLYKNGKVILLIDDINDSPSNIKSFVGSLIESFEDNNGNRLLIASRYIYPNLKIVYQIDELSLNDGIDLILSILNKHTSDNGQFASNVDEKSVIQERIGSLETILKEFCQNSEQMTNYWKVPLFFKMIADFMKNKKHIKPDIFKILSNYVETIYREGMKQKNFGTELEFKRYFFNLARRSFEEINENRLEQNRNYFDVHELVYKENGNIFFLHEIFRDYFIVEFAITKLIDIEITQEFLKYFNKYLSDPEYKGVRYLFDNALNDGKVFNSIKRKQRYLGSDLISQIKLSDILKTIFSEKLVFVSKFLTILCKDTSSKEILQCLNDIKITSTHSLKILGKIIEFVDKSYIESFLRSKKIFHELIEFDVSIEEINEFAKILDNRGLADVVREEIRSKHEHTGETLLHLACKYPHKLKGMFELLKTFQTDGEKSEFFETTDFYGNTFLHTFVGIENNQSNESSTTSTSLVPAGTHNLYLEFLLNEMFDTYKNNESKMKHLMLIKNFQNQTFIHAYIIENKTQEIEMLFNILRKRFGKYLGVVYSRHFKNRNLLQIAACESNETGIQDILWTIFMESFESTEEFIKILKDKDEDGQNILQLVASYGAIKIFNHIISKIEALLQDKSIELIQYLFESVDNSQNNLLLLIAKENKSWEFHENIWLILNKDFDNSKLWELINQVNNDRNNFFGTVIKYQEIRVVTSVWNQIKHILDDQSLLNQRNYMTESVKDYIFKNEEVKTFVESRLCQLKIEKDDLVQVETKGSSFQPSLNVITITSFVAIIIAIFAIIYLKWPSNFNASFNGLSNENRLKIRNSIVLYKKVNVKFDNLVCNSLIAYDKLSKDHIARFLSGKELNLDESIFYDVTSIIHHKWENLDNNLKHKILNSNFKFQNEVFKYEIFRKSYQNFFDKLTSDQILSIFDEKLLKIGKMVQEIKPPDLQNGKIQHSNLFLQNTKLTKNDYKIISNFDFDKVINEEFQETKFFILKQEVFNEKLTSFNLDTIIKLKKKFPKYWIAYIDLRECVHLFNENEKSTNIIKFLIDCLKLENDYEKNFFELSYELNRIILLWDAFDEVMSVHRDFVNSLMELTYSKSSNIQFVCVQVSYDSLQDDDQENIRKSFVIYKNVKLRLNELFHNNLEGYKALSPVHTSQLLNNENLELKDSQFRYLDKFINFNWENLNRHLKEKILNMNVLFQNEKVTFKSLDQLHPNIFLSLTSEQICNILDDIPFEIGKMVHNPIDTNIINERIKFLEENESDEIMCSNKTIFSDIKEYEFLNDGFNLVSNDNLHEFITTDGNQNPKFFILTLETTAEVLKGFDQNSIQNIKKKFPTRWIIYVNFPQFRENLSKYKNFDNLENLYKIFDINLSGEFDKKFFESSYRSGNIIFFWDGIYEIKKENNDDILKLMTKINKETTNVQFISSKRACIVLNIEYERNDSESSSIYNWIFNYYSLLLIGVLLLIVLYKRAN